MSMKYIKTTSLPRVNDPILNRALDQINEELDKIARVFIDWTDATQDFKTSGTLTLPNVGLHLLDTNASHDLIIKPGSDLTADRILTLTTGNAARTITLSGNPMLNDWFDQAVKQASSPTFVTAKLSGLTDGYVPYHIDDATGLADSPIFTDGTDVSIFNSLTIKRAANDCILNIYAYDTTPGDCSQIKLRTSDSNTIDTLSETQDGDYLGRVSFWGVDDASLWREGVRITAVQNGAAGTGEVPTDLYLETYSATALNTGQLVLVNDGTITASGCITDGTCEIMKDEDALAIIDDILKTGSGKKDKYNHERMDMKKIYKKYPYMIYERKGADEEGNKTIEYYDKLGAKSDLLYVAIGQLVGRVEALEARFNN